MEKLFVRKASVVREIWGKADTILFIFAAAAAEFALNKAVDWLFFTGKLPTDPIGRLFSTVQYAKKIVFSKEKETLATIAYMNDIHKKVEEARGIKIPAWAYRDVLFMLIDYSIRSFELLERKLLEEEKDEVYQVFKRVGEAMKVESLPESHNDWLVMRQDHLEVHLEYSHFTKKLFAEYKKHLGTIRYKLLLQAQMLVLPELVKEKLNMSHLSYLSPAVPVYKVLSRFNLDWAVKSVLLPSEYIQEIKALDKKSY